MSQKTAGEGEVGGELRGEGAVRSRMCVGARDGAAELEVRNLMATTIESVSLQNCCEVPRRPRLLQHCRIGDRSIHT